MHCVSVCMHCVSRQACSLYTLSLTFLYYNIADLLYFTPASESEVPMILSQCPRKPSDSGLTPTWILKNAISNSVKQLEELTALCRSIALIIRIFGMKAWR